MKKILSVLMCVVMLAGMCINVSAAEFSDMPDNWATDALEKAVENGLLQGDNGKIMPNDNLTRAQMATIMVRAFGETKTADISSYGDVSANAWYYDYMASAVAMGIIQGDGKNLNPDTPITREQVFTVLVRAFSLPDAESDALDSFKDKNAVSDWATEYVASIVASGYVKGSDGYLNPTNNITRAEFAVVMDNIVKYYIVEGGDYTGTYTGNVMLRTKETVNFMDVVFDGDLFISTGANGGAISFLNVENNGRIINNSDVEIYMAVDGTTDGDNNKKPNDGKQDLTHGGIGSGGVIDDGSDGFEGNGSDIPSGGREDGGEF